MASIGLKGFWLGGRRRFEVYKPANLKKTQNLSKTDLDLSEQRCETVSDSKFSRLLENLLFRLINEWPLFDLLVQGQ